MTNVKLTEPHPLSEPPVAVDPQGLDERRDLIILVILVILVVLVEPTAARHQLATARRASLKVATRVVRSTTDDRAVAAPIAAHSPLGLVAERNMVEATPIPMERIDGAREGHRHLTMTPAADGHHATLRSWGLSAGHSGVQSERSSGNCG
jgi:hypothetical protein